MLLFPYGDIAQWYGVGLQNPDSPVQIRVSPPTRTPVTATVTGVSFGALAPIKPTVQLGVEKIL